MGYEERLWLRRGMRIQTSEASRGPLYTFHLQQFRGFRLPWPMSSMESEDLRRLACVGQGKPWKQFARKVDSCCYQIRIGSSVLVSQLHEARSNAVKIIQSSHSEPTPSTHLPSGFGILRRHGYLCLLTCSTLNGQDAYLFCLR